MKYNIKVDWSGHQGRSDYERAKKYGIKPGDYDLLLDAQDFRCAICNDQQADLCVDHDHETGVVRGLLCTQCNTMLGMANDDPSILERGMEYLQDKNKLFKDNLALFA